ncbi:MAG: hypothetical protein KKH08_03495 [Candidatus Omnitrophica bacterium]|nr:hypothetical protein [Candidatus Omnitrophota bacterium]
MDKTLRSILWILVALVIFSSFSTGWFFVAKERIYNDYTNLEKLFKSNVDKLNKDLAISREEKEKLSLKLAKVEKELSETEFAKKDITVKYESILKDRDDINKELARVKKGKFFLEKKIKEVESDAFTADLLKEKTFLEVELSRLKSSFTPKDSEIEALKKKNQDMVAKLFAIGRDKDFLEQKVRDSETVAEVLSRDLLKEKDSKGKDRESLDKVLADNRFLNNKVEELEKNLSGMGNLFAERDNMKMKIASLEKDLDLKNSEIERINVAFNSRNKRSEEYRAEAYHSPQEVDLPPIVLETGRHGTDRVSASSFDMMSNSSTLKGRVVTVNREHNFVVIDLGEQDGVGIGTMFNVYRKNILIAQLKTIQCRQRISACDIIDAKEEYYVEIDDIIAK